MNWERLFDALPNATPILRHINSQPILSVILASVLGLSGCIQNSPPPLQDRTVRLLLELLLDEGPEIRRIAAESLGKIGNSGTTDAILPLLHDPVPIVREAAVIAVGRLKPLATQKIVTLLTERLQDPIESVRQGASRALSEVDPAPEFLPPIVELLRSSDLTIRRATAQTMIWLNASDSIPALLQAGRDSDATVRQEIVAAVSEWGGVDAIPWLRERLIHDPAPGVRAEAAYQLGLQNDPTTQALRKARGTKDPDSVVRRWAQYTR